MHTLVPTHPVDLIDFRVVMSLSTSSYAGGEGTVALLQSGFLLYGERIQIPKRPNVHSFPKNQKIMSLKY